MIKLTIKKLFRNKVNITMIIIFAICSLTLTGALMFEKNYIQMQKDDFDKNVDGRTLLVSPSKKIIEELSESGFENYEYDYKSILAIKHIQAVFDSNLETFGETTLKNDDYDGYVNFRYGNEYTLPNNIKGEKFSGNDSGVVICPKNFYPDSNDITSDSKYIDGETLLNTTFDFTYKDYVTNSKGINRTKTFKIIGLYDNTVLKEKSNTCFATAKDLQEMYDVELAVLNKGALMSINVIVDDIKNLPYVKEELTKLNLRGSDKLVIDNNAVSGLRVISYTCIVFAIIMIIGITITYMKKRNIMNKKEIGVFSSLGFSSLQIQTIYMVDILVLSAISTIISTILSFVVYFFILKKYEIYFINALYQPKLYILRYLLAYLVTIIVPLLINYVFTRLSLKNSDNYLMKEAL